MVAVTVLMAVFRPPLGMLDEAIHSILAQTYGDFEFLILDDGSPASDPSHERLATWAVRDARVRLVQEPHRGLTAALNRGLALAHGTWIARQDADDWSAPERLARQIAYLETHPYLAVCGTNAWTHQEDGRRLWPTRLPLAPAEVLDAFPRGNPLVHGSTFFRRDWALEAGGYREVFRCSQDYDLFWRLAEVHGAGNLAQPLYHYRYTSGSISARRALEQRRAHRAIRRLAEARRRGESEDPEAALAQAARELDAGSGAFRSLLKQADHRMLAGDYRRAAVAYGELLRTHPTHPLGWAKLGRLAIFRTLPFLREVCFR